MYNRFRRFALFAVGASVPIQGFAFTAGGLAATPFKLTTALLMVLAAVQYAARTGGRSPDRKTVWVLAFLVSFAVATVMALVAGLPPTAVLRSSSTMIALGSFYFLLGYAVESREDVILVLWAIVLGGAVTVLPAVGQAPTAQPGTVARFAGLAGQENLLGADMNVCLAAAMALFFISRSTFKKGVLAVAGAAALAGIALSLSRSAFVALAMMWALWMYRSGSRGNIQYAVLAAMLAIMGLVFLPEAVVDRLNTIFDATQRAQDGSIQGRMYVNIWAVKAFFSNPLLGVGTPRFAVWVHEQQAGGGATWHTVHNAYLGVAAEQGLLGIVPFIAILTLSWTDYTATWKAARAHRLIRDQALVEIGHLSLFLQLALLSGIVGGLFHQQHRSKTMWMVMALSPVVLSLARNRVAALQGPDAQVSPLFPEASDPRHDTPHSPAAPATG